MNRQVKAGTRRERTEREKIEGGGVRREWDGREEMGTRVSFQTNPETRRRREREEGGKK